MSKIVWTFQCILSLLLVRTESGVRLPKVQISETCVVFLAKFTISCAEQRSFCLPRRRFGPAEMKQQRPRESSQFLAEHLKQHFFFHKGGDVSSPQKAPPMRG